MLNPATLGVMIPIIAMMIPIVAILSKHQREMALMMRQDQSNGLNSVLPQIMHELQSLRAEVTSMKQQLNDVTLAVDDHKSLQQRLNTPPTQEIGQ